MKKIFTLLVFFLSFIISSFGQQYFLSMKYSGDDLNHNDDELSIVASGDHYTDRHDFSTHIITKTAGYKPYDCNNLDNNSFFNTVRYSYYDGFLGWSWGYYSLENLILPITRIVFYPRTLNQTTIVNINIPVKENFAIKKTDLNICKSFDDGSLCFEAFYYRSPKVPTISCASGIYNEGDSITLDLGERDATCKYVIEKT